MIDKVNDYQYNNPWTEKDGDWIRGTYYTGVMACFQATADNKLLNQSNAWGESLEWKLPALRPGERGEPVTLLTAAQTFLESYMADKKDYKMDQEHPEAVITLLPGKDGIMEAAIEQYPFGWKSKEFTKSFSGCVNDMQESLNNWKSPEVPDEYKETADLASYINWSCVVQKRGFLKRTVMYSSKNKMCSIWAWDCCFFSIANSYHQPEFAWDQYMVFFDQQNEQGSFPAYLNDGYPLWGFHQPPIQGWALFKMMEANPEIASLKNFREIYSPLKKWTNFWFDYMDDDNNGLPQVNHGFDSWDNATVFDMGFSAEPPDLYAYLILQMDALAMIAEKLGIKDEAEQWKGRSEHLLHQLIDTFWNGETFIYRRTGDHIRNEKSQSLMPYLPLVLGERLPENIRNKMLNDLKSPDGLLTAIGLASENPNSPLFIPDGYWRGAIWAVSTLIMADGIWVSGDKEFAREIARRFCENSKKHGFGETFHPFTGESLRDRSLPWSAAPFLVLAHRYLNSPLIRINN